MAVIAGRKKVWDAKIRIEYPLRESVMLIAREAGCRFSECVEALLLLTEAKYTASSGDELIYRFLELKSEHIRTLEDIRVKAPRASCHVMLSAPARDFVMLLFDSYPPVFGSTNEVIALCLQYWQPCCQTKEHLGYVAQRLRCFIGEQ